jgi:hypothetical protein
MTSPVGFRVVMDRVDGPDGWTLRREVGVGVGSVDVDLSGIDASDAIPEAICDDPVTTPMPFAALATLGRTPTKPLDEVALDALLETTRTA